MDEDPGQTGGNGLVRARQLSWELEVWDTAANVVGAAVAFVLLVVLDASRSVPEPRRTEVAVMAVIAVALGTVVATGLSRRHARPLMEAIEHEQPIQGAARDAVFSVPGYCAVISVLIWWAAAVYMAFESVLRLGNSAGHSVKFAFVIALGGLSTGLVVFLTSERRLRPYVAEAFAVGNPDPAGVVSVRTRLLATWGLGSAVPMLVAGLVLLDRSPDGDLLVAVMPWLVLGLVLGGLTALRTAAGLVGPLTELRDAQARVQQGDFDVRCPVDDAGEIGVLQAGFNEMAAGLREREVMRDLFGRHVGEEVARRALRAGPVLGGEQVEASALFVDLIDSTSLALALDPQEVVLLLDDLFGAVVAAAERQGGWVNKFEGDAALCVFGPPIGTADHAAAALAAGAALHREVALLRHRHPQLDVGIGLSSGTVFAGNVGVEHRFEYTIIGDPVNEAARLSELAKTDPCRMFASDQIVARAGIGASSGWECVAARTLRGRDAPTSMWALRPSPSTELLLDRPVAAAVQASTVP
jgi:class 3 adenylate cyclase